MGQDRRKAAGNRLISLYIILFCTILVPPEPHNTLPLKSFQDTMQSFASPEHLKKNGSLELVVIIKNLPQQYLARSSHREATGPPGQSIQMPA
jgi:hypothetical protein